MLTSLTIRRYQEYKLIIQKRARFETAATHGVLTLHRKMMKDLDTNTHTQS